MKIERENELRGIRNEKIILKYNINEDNVKIKNEIISKHGEMLDGLFGHG